MKRTSHEVLFTSIHSFLFHHDPITPAFFPPDLLVRWAAFSKDEALLYFIGEWWK
jgi:hypothetical protein